MAGLDFYHTYTSHVRTTNRAKAWTERSGICAFPHDCSRSMPPNATSRCRDWSSRRLLGRWAPLFALLVQFVTRSHAQAHWELAWNSEGGSIEPPNRRSHGMALLNDTMYVHGGVGLTTGQDDLWAFDLDRRVWWPISQYAGAGLTSLPDARAGML